MLLPTLQDKMFSRSARPLREQLASRLRPSKATLMASDGETEAATSYRRNVGICLVNPAGLVFAARRCDDESGTWQMPQGGIDNYENAMAAAVRELREETGIRSARIVSTMDQWLTYEFPTAVRNQMTGSISRFKGQTQKWMLMYFHGEESEIDLEGCGEREFLEHAWMQLDELPDRVVPFKRGVYEAVARDFSPLIRARQQSRRMGDSWWSRPR